jgi:hypothetical protein
MPRILVTTQDNATIFEDGSFQLKDEKIFGYLVKIHTLQALIETENGPVAGVVQKAEVYWSHNRSLAAILCDVQDLVWLAFEDEFDEEEEEAEGDDESVEYDYDDEREVNS